MDERRGSTIMALHHADPGEVVDLAPLGPDLRSARTTAIIKADGFEAIRLIVRAGTEIPRHQVAGDITLHCLEGHVELVAEDSPVALAADQWVYLEGGAPHSLRAIADSSLLLTIFLDR
jgi:quercetin dioxygenase-like cupin family protein